MNKLNANTVELSVPASKAFVQVVEDCILAMLRRIGQLEADEQSVYNVQLAIHETCINILEHAYGAGANGRIQFQFSITEEPLQFVIEMVDQGRPFSIDDVPAPDPEQLQVRGYGLYLIQQLMDETIYTPTADGNRWRLIKNL